MYDWDFPCPFRQTKIPNTRSTHYQTVLNGRPFSHDGQCVFHGSFLFVFYFCTDTIATPGFMHQPHKHVNTMRLMIALYFGQCSIKVKFGDSVFIVGNVKTLYCAHLLYVLWQSRGQATQVDFRLALVFIINFAQVKEHTFNRRQRIDHHQHHHQQKFHFIFYFKTRLPTYTCLYVRVSIRGDDRIISFCWTLRVD